VKRHIPGLHSRCTEESPLEGLFFVRVEGASYQWHPQKPYFSVRFVVIEPEPVANRTFSGRLYCTEKAHWRLQWFLRDFGYDQELLGDDQVDEKALVNLRGVLRTTQVIRSGKTFQNLEAFAPEAAWEELSCAAVRSGKNSDGL
jgi:hypothetical protein